MLARARAVGEDDLAAREEAVGRAEVLVPDLDAQADRPLAPRRQLELQPLALPIWIGRVVSTGFGFISSYAALLRKILGPPTYLPPLAPSIYGNSMVPHIGGQPAELPTYPPLVLRSRAG